MWGDAPFPCEINEMGEDVAGGGADQGGRHLGVDSGGEVIGGGGAGAQGGEDFGLAGLAVGDEPVEAGGGVGNRGAVAGMELGILLTRPESGLGDLLINMARGAQIGLVVGAVAFAAAGGALAYIAADELLKNQG